LTTRRLDRPAANKPAPIGNFFVVHSPSVSSKVVLLPSDRLATLAAGRFESRDLLQHRPLSPVP
jgi:hypothetical protein